MKLILWALLALVVLALAATLLQASRFGRDIEALERRLAASPAGAPRDDLPPVVAAFAARALLGAAPVGAVRLSQSVEMRLKPGAAWSPLVARQTNAMTEPGFAWVAAQRLGPLPLARVLDSYAYGAGRLEVRLLGAWRLGLYAGPEAARAQAMRYLAELPWFPDAIVTNRALRWAEGPEGISVSLDTAGGAATVSFGFDAAGDIVSMLARGRPATLADGSVVPLDWRGSLGAYGEIGGRRVPLSGEVGYEYPTGYEAYWRGTITGYMPLASAAN